jgi:hypothetical protein
MVVNNISQESGVVKPETKFKKATEPQRAQRKRKEEAIYLSPFPLCVLCASVAVFGI